jgi:hypothetical protein
MKCNDVFSVSSASLPWCRVIEKKEKVSLAWVVRDASEKYVVSNAKQGREGGRL